MIEHPMQKMFEFRRLLILSAGGVVARFLFGKIIDICRKSAIIGGVNGICHKSEKLGEPVPTDAESRWRTSPLLLPGKRGEKMPRPRKWRKVCRLPGNTRFGPLGGTDTEERITMTVDEYETIRLIDLKRFTQEECAGQMNVARTTVQGIYDNARKKLADSLVNGKVLLIGGGEYILCDGLEEVCGCGGCHRHRCGRRFKEDVE